MSRGAALAAALGVAACASSPPGPPAELFAPREGAAAAQERRFDGVSAQALSQAALQVLQDSSFIIKASDPELGLIIAARGESKKSPDEELKDAMRTLGIIYWDTLRLRFRSPDAYAPAGASNVVVAVAPTPSGSTARITFHSVGWVRTPAGATTAPRELPGPELPQKFFALLEQALAGRGKAD